LWESNIYEMEATIFNTIIQYFTKFGPDHWMVILTFIAISITAVTFIKNQKFIQKQQFETTFFNMINKLNDIVENLTITYDQRISSTPIQINGNSRSQEHQIRKVTINGRNIFKFLYESNKIRFTPPDIIAEIVFSLKENRQSFHIENNNKIYYGKTDKKFSIYGYSSGSKNIGEEYDIVFFNLKSLIGNFGVFGYENYEDRIVIEHYFRYLYRVLLFVDESTHLDNKGTIDERYKYISILRSTLTTYELIFIFYNGLSYNGKKLKPLLEKYSLLKNINTTKMVNSKNTFYKIDDDQFIFSDYNDDLNDCNRFKTDIKGDPYKYYWSAFEKDQSAFKNKN
jgi:hypothetical protein